MKTYNVVYAKDMLTSLAKKLPGNLVVDNLTEEGQFASDFLIHLNELQLSFLKNEAKKHNDENFFLFFYSVPKEKFGKESPKAVRNFTTFDFSQVESVCFNGNTAPILKYRDSDPIHYVSVTLVLKD